GGRPDRARALADEAARAYCAPETARQTTSRTRARVDLVRAGLELEHGVPQAAGRMLLDRAASCDDPAVRAELLEEAAFHAWTCGDAETAARAAKSCADAGAGEQVTVAALSALLDDDVAAARRLLADRPGGAADERLRLLSAEAALLAG